MGYKRNRDLHGAPYVWRAAPDGHNATGAFYDKLQSLIETSVERNAAKATIVTHSLGGPTTLAFLASRPAGWVAKYVASFVPISAPWGGATLMARADISGDNFGLPLVPSDYLKPVQKTSASGVFLLPMPTAFGDHVVVRAGSTNYSAADMPALLGDLGLSQAAAVHAHLEQLALNADDLPAPPVRTLCITSKGVKTAQTYVYSDAMSPGFDKTPDSVEYGDGDGTVNLVSLRYGQDGGWPTDGVPRSFMTVDGVAHFDMVKDSSVLAAIAAFIGQNASSVDVVEAS